MVLLHFGRLVVCLSGMPKQKFSCRADFRQNCCKYPSVALLREDSVEELDPPFLSHARTPMGTALALESLGGNSVK